MIKKLNFQKSNDRTGQLVVQTVGKGEQHKAIDSQTEKKNKLPTQKPRKIQLIGNTQHPAQVGLTDD